nr:circumsporozoite protein [Aegilops tauschii subsp. strangulata]
MPRTASGSGRNRPAGRRRPDEGHGQEEAAAGGRGRGLEEAAAGGAVAAGGRGSRRIEGGAGQAAGGDRRTGPAWERPPAESSGTCESWPPAAEARPGRAKGRRAAAGPQAAVRDEAAAARTKSRRRAVVEAGGGQMSGNGPLIRQIFLAPDADAILTSPRPKTSQEDIWAWTWESSGVVSVRSAYRETMLRSRSRDEEIGGSTGTEQTWKAL